MAAPAFQSPEQPLLGDAVEVSRGWDASGKGSTRSYKGTVERLPCCVTPTCPRRLRLSRTACGQVAWTIRPGEPEVVLTSGIPSLGSLFNPWPDLWGEWGRKE